VTSVSTDDVRTRPSSVSEYRPTAIRCERSVGCDGAADCSTEKAVNRPSVSML
jgi:hypothetical protein